MTPALAHLCVWQWYMALVNRISSVVLVIIGCSPIVNYDIVTLDWIYMIVPLARLMCHLNGVCLVFWYLRLCMVWCAAILIMHLCMNEWMKSSNINTGSSNDTNIIYGPWIIQQYHPQRSLVIIIWLSCLFMNHYSRSSLYSLIS